MGLFDERIAYKPFEYPEYYTEGWLKQAQAFWLHTEISMQSDIKDWATGRGTTRRRRADRLHRAYRHQRCRCRAHRGPGRRSGSAR